MPSASKLVRPGSSTANAIIRRNEVSPGMPPIYTGGWWVQRVRFSNYSAASTQQLLDLNVAFPHNTFPTGVILLAGAHVDLIQTFSGGSVSAATVRLGDSGASNGLLTDSNVFTGATTGSIFTPSATEYRQYNNESAFVPTLRLDTTTANINTLTQGIVDVWIPYTLIPTVRPVNGY